MVSDMRALLAWCVALFFTLCAGCAYAQDRPRSLDELLERARQQREQSGLPTPSTPITAGWPAPQTPQIQQTPQKTIVQGEIGGRIDHHWSRFRDIYNSGANVEVHGKCQSACTLITNMPNECVSRKDRGLASIGRARKYGTARHRVRARNG